MAFNVSCGLRPFDYFYFSRPGASHITADKPCQDSAQIQVDQPADESRQCIILAVADGHGDEKHDLSERGARIATDRAVENLKYFHRNRNPAEIFYNVFRRDFPRHMVRDWQEWVILDAKSENIFRLDKPDEWKPIYTRYGTTLLAAMADKDYIYCAQLGDGDIVSVNKSGKAETVIETQDEMLGNVTFSLSSNDPSRLWKFSRLSRSECNMLFLSTDGLANSFIDESAFLNWSEKLYRSIIEYGVEKIAEAMPGWLDDYSLKGSGDDISIACVFFGSETETEAQNENPLPAGENKTENENEDDFLD